MAGFPWTKAATSVKCSNDAGGWLQSHCRRCSPYHWRNQIRSWGCRAEALPRNGRFNHVSDVVYMPRFGIPNSKVLTVQFESNKRAFGRGQMSPTVPSRIPNNWPHVQTQRNDHHPNPGVLWCGLYGRRQQKIDFRIRFSPCWDCHQLASEEANNSCSIDSRRGICSDGTYGKRADVAYNTFYETSECQSMCRQSSSATIMGAISLVKNPTYHMKTKHVNLHLCFIWDHVVKGMISVEYCPTEDMLADLMTNRLTCERHERLLRLMGVE